MTLRGYKRHLHMYSLVLKLHGRGDGVVVWLERAEKMVVSCGRKEVVICNL